MEIKPRSMQDRRSGKERRHLAGIKRLLAREDSHRSPMDRRSSLERRSGWVRLSKWSSVYLADLKLAKWLKRFH